MVIKLRLGGSKSFIRCAQVIEGLVLVSLILGNVTVDLIVIILGKLICLCPISLKILISFRCIVYLVELSVPLALLGIGGVLSIGCSVVKLIELLAQLIVLISSLLKRGLSIGNGLVFLVGSSKILLCLNLLIDSRFPIGPSVLCVLSSLVSSVQSIVVCLAGCVGLIHGIVVCLLGVRNGLVLLLGDLQIGLRLGLLTCSLGPCGLCVVRILTSIEGLVVELVVLNTECVGGVLGVLVSLLGIGQSVLGGVELVLGLLLGSLSVLKGVLGLLVAGLSLGLGSLSLVVGLLGLLDVSLSLVVGLLGLLNVGLSGSNLFLAGLLLLGLDVIVGVGAGLSESSGLQDRRQSRLAVTAMVTAGLARLSLDCAFLCAG